MARKGGFLRRHALFVGFVAGCVVVLLLTFALVVSQTHEKVAVDAFEHRRIADTILHRDAAIDRILEMFSLSDSTVADDMVPVSSPNTIAQTESPWLHKYKDHPLLVTDLHDGLRRGSAGNPGGVAFVTMINAPWLLMLQHMLYTAVVNGNIKSVLVVALDEEGLQSCLYDLRVKMPCMDGSQYVGHLESGSEKLLNTDEYVRITWARPKMIAAMLRYDIPIVNVDTDIVFLGPIDPLVERPCSDTAIFSCSCELDYCNMGFYLIRPHDKTRHFWNSYLEYEDSYLNDQEVFQRVEHMLPDVQKCCLDETLFSNSCLQPHRNIPDSGAIVWHAICMTGLEVKTEYFRSRNAWFFPSSRNETLTMIDEAERIRAKSIQQVKASI